MNPARYSDMSDPDRNPNFRRRWTESHHPNKPMAMDRQADPLLAVGQHIAAEWLSHAASRRREGGR